MDITSLTDRAACEELFKDIHAHPSEEVGLGNCPVLHNCVLKIDPYVGLDYHAFDYSRFKAVLHGAYHSGTVCTEKTEKTPGYGTQSFLHLLDRCDGKTDVYLSPAKENGEVYDSVGLITYHDRGKAHFLYGCTNEMTYVKLLLAYALGAEDVVSFMRTEFNGEFVYS